MKQDRIRIVVDFPAPFGPRKPTISPGATLNDTSRMAVTGPYCLVSPWTSIMRRSWAKQPTGDYSTGPPSQILAVADLLDDSANALVRVDRDQQVFGRHGRGIRALRRPMDFRLERPPEDLGNVGAAHAAHHGQDLAMLDRLEERPAGLALGPGAQQPEDL